MRKNNKGFLSRVSGGDMSIGNVNAYNNVDIQDRSSYISTKNEETTINDNSTHISINTDIF
jgi:hypothetical protein